jgi:hypothetical protein
MSKMSFDQVIDELKWRVSWHDSRIFGKSITQFYFQINASAASKRAFNYRGKYCSNCKDAEGIRSFTSLEFKRPTVQLYDDSSSKAFIDTFNHIIEYRVQKSLEPFLLSDLIAIVVDYAMTTMDCRAKQVWIPHSNAYCTNQFLGF